MIFNSYKPHFRLGMVDSGLDVSQCWQLPPTWHQPHRPSHSSGRSGEMLTSILGLDLCTPHQCQCGETADPRGHHELVCRQSAGRSARHFAVNDLVWRALTKADTPCTKEPSGLIRTDGKRPDGATLVPWARGKYIAWDFTAIHTCAASYLHL